jgi:hypothetical protein
MVGRESATGTVVVFPRLWQREPPQQAVVNAEIVRFPQPRRAVAIGECPFLPLWRDNPDPDD